MKPRIEQLPPNTYAPLVSNLLAFYYRGPDHPLKLRLLNYIETLLGCKRIIVSTIPKFKIAVDRSDLIQRTLLYDGIYEPELTRLLMKEFNVTDIFFDIGANIGYYTCIALSCGVKKVIAFEPDPISCEVLNLNIRLNKFSSSRIDVIQKAIGDKVGVGHFNRAHVANVGMSGFELSNNIVASFDVHIETLDHLIDSKSLPLPTVIKIDVEGWEEKVLNGALKLLKNSPPKIIVFETDCDSSGIIKNQRIVKLLEDNGYFIRFSSFVEPFPSISGIGKGNYIARLNSIH